MHMNKIFIIAAKAFAVLLSSCSSSTSSDENDQNTAADSTLAPVETKEPNTNYKPAFEGQTRIAGVKTTTPYEFKVLAEGLDQPWGITNLPDGRFLITQKTGTMRIASEDGTLGEPITGLPKVNSAEQGGLLGLTLDPSFADNRMVYWVFSQPVTGGNLTAVAKGRLAGDEKTIENAQVIYQATPAHGSTLHYGGRILFDKTGNIIFSTGERSDLETRPLAQDLNTSLGKVIGLTR